MKSFIFSMAIFAISASPLFAQNDKSEIIDAVAKNHSWLPSVMVDNFVVINFSKEFWDKMMAEQDSPIGIKTFNNLGSALAVY